MTELPPSATRVRDSARAIGLDITVRIMSASTRTAEEAAAACGCDVAQIVKSLLFRGRDSGEPVLVLASGRNRVNEVAIAKSVGEVLQRADADYVREVTGFAIGGVPPFGHIRPLIPYFDRDLLDHDIVWAAAGTPKAVFSVAPGALAAATKAIVVPVI